MQKIKWADPMMEEVLVSTEVIMASPLENDALGDASGMDSDYDNPNGEI